MPQPDPHMAPQPASPTTLPPASRTTLPASRTMPPPTPHEVRATFSALLESDAESAVAYLHELGISSRYIKEEAIAKNIRWTAESPYGAIECTINLSKPEKDPAAIAAEAEAIAPPVAEATASPLRIPHCDLCWENEGFPGTPDHPAKPGLRIAAISLGGECWGLQYSPYAYFAEHCIALSQEHRPMKIDAPCFERLLDFVDAFPFYFIGSNADLPIVGGSILSHDHFQGGRHVFPLMKSPIKRDISLDDFPHVRCGIVDWPASTLRLASDDRDALVHVASKVLDAWLSYTNEACGIIAADPVQHNTLNPIVRKAGPTYLMDLVLRNNRTDAEHPWGIFHAPEPMHHIKKENIGLIEIMGLAILPPRLAVELPLVQQELFKAVREGLSPDELSARLEARSETMPHAAWATEIYRRRKADLVDAALPSATFPRPEPFGALHPIIEQEVGRVFLSILEATGVFKHDAAGDAGWDAFIAKIAG